jgi:hypothetical protein
VYFHQDRFRKAVDCEELRSLCEHPNSRRSRNHIATLINTAASFFTGDAQGYAFVLESKYRQPLLQAAHSSSQPSSLPSDQTLSLMLGAHLTSRQFKTITKQATHKWVEDEDGAGHYELQQAWTRWASYYEPSSMYHDMDLGKIILSKDGKCCRLLIIPTINLLLSNPRISSTVECTKGKLVLRFSFDGSGKLVLFSFSFALSPFNNSPLHNIIWGLFHGKETQADLRALSFKHP